MTRYRSDIDWATAFVTCPICGRRQYGKRAENWRPRERVCLQCTKDYTEAEIASMLEWLQRRCVVSRDKSLIFVVEWKKRHGGRAFGRSK